MKLVCLWPPLQQMRQSKTFILSLREAVLPWLCCTTNNVVHCKSNNNNKCICTSRTLMIVLTAIAITLGRHPIAKNAWLVKEYNSSQQSTSMMTGQWATMTCAPLSVPDSPTVRRLSSSRLAPLLILRKPQYNSSWRGTQRTLNPSWCWPVLWQYHPMVLSSTTMLLKNHNARSSTMLPYTTISYSCRWSHWATP